MSGRIRVVDYRRERRLIVGGAILSAYPLDGDWSAIEREYWWQGVASVRFPPRPRVLLVGLGGGTQAHLVHRLTTPRLITVIERDEIIVWDQSRVWIYTQDRPFTGKQIYKPVRNPMYNDSNYRATVSLPPGR